MTVPKHGTKVSVSFTGTVKDDPVNVSAATYGIPSYLLPSYAEDSGFIVVRDDHGTDHLVWHASSSRERSVYTVVSTPEPENWPPRVGDIWQAESREYVVRQNRASASHVVVECVDGGLVNSMFGSARLGDFKALKPVLLRRR